MSMSMYLSHVRHSFKHEAMYQAMYKHFPTHLANAAHVEEDTQACKNRSQHLKAAALLSRRTCPASIHERVHSYFDRCSVCRQACRRASWYKHVGEGNWKTWLALCRTCERDIWRDCTKLEPGAWPYEGHTLYKWKDLEEENRAFLDLAMRKAGS